MNPLNSLLKKPVLLSFLFIITFGFSSYAQESQLVYLSGDTLVYSPFAVKGQTNEAHVVPDFSYSGYQGGGVSLPTNIPVKIEISPKAGDDTKRIQEAIDSVSSLPRDENGFRGAILLKKGYYTTIRTLQISTSGVVLTGEGQGKNGSVIHANLRSKHTIIEIKGSGGLQVNESTNQLITTSYVPIGSYTFTIFDASSYQVGDTIAVTRTPNQKWINDLGMDEETLCAGDEGCNGWTPSSYTINNERIIKAIKDNEITIDIPIVDVMEDQYGGGKIAKASAPDRINNCGVENIRLESIYVSSNDEDHAWTGVELSNAHNCWVTRVTGQYLSYSTVSIENANLTTVQDCAYIDPVSEISGGRRYSFVIGGGLGNFFQRNYSNRGRHDFATGSRVTGPNVFLDGLGENGNADIGPHHRWATGILFENIVANQLRIQNRGSSGSGHGWAGAQNMFWNVTSYRDDVKVESPLGAINWGIGCKGPTQNGEGYWESWGVHVLPRSLYLQQLKDRLGSEAVDNIASESQLNGEITNQLSEWKGIGSIYDVKVVGNAPDVVFSEPNSRIFMDTWEGSSILVNATDEDGSLEEVTLLINGEPIGVLTDSPFLFENVRPFLEPLSGEQHVLSAIAMDNDGNIDVGRLSLIGTERTSISLHDFEPIELCNAMATSHNDAAIADKVIDKNESEESRWSAEEYGAMLVVEACDALHTDAIGIKWYRGDERQAFFDLEVSLDSVNWTNVYAGSSTGNQQRQEPFLVGGDSIKYIRYTGYGNSDSRWNSIIEVGFYKKNAITEVLSTTEIQKEQLIIYPNPTDASMTISNPFNSDSRLIITDLSGQLILERIILPGTTFIETSHFNQGTYILKLSDGMQEMSTKLVINEMR